MKKVLYTIVVSIIGGLVAIIVHNSTYDHSSYLDEVVQQNQ